MMLPKFQPATRFIAIVGLLSSMVILSRPLHADDDKVLVGSKAFTESVILGELLSHVARASGAKAEHRAELGGTQVLWKALQSGEIDMYVEYTGTLREEILNASSSADEQDLRDQLKEYSVSMTPHLGFNNTYALGVPRKLAEQLKLETIDDLNQRLDLRFGFSDEFLDRVDGWPGLQAKYQLKHESITGLDHVMACRGLSHGSLDITDVYSTDAEIDFYQLKVLQDNRQFFPKYFAVVLYRDDLQQRFPAVASALNQLENSLSNEKMMELNSDVRLRRKSEKDVAGDFANKDLGIKAEWERDDANSWFRKMLKRLVVTTGQHLMLVVISLLAAIVISIPLGIIPYRFPKFETAILGTIGIIQTLPSMALLVFMIPLLGLGTLPAIVALFLYSLLPIVRGTHSGLKQIAEPLRESAEVLGLSPWRRLTRIELPLASPSIMAGIKTAAVINIGTATIGALIGAGGYGQPILTGIRLADLVLILQGAVPAALLALLVQYAFSWLEALVVPAGLRQK
jgi:osmoprotectant transport system permease protein